MKIITKKNHFLKQNILIGIKYKNINLKLIKEKEFKQKNRNMFLYFLKILCKKFKKTNHKRIHLKNEIKELEFQ